MKTTPPLSCPAGSKKSPCHLVRNGTRLRKPKNQSGSCPTPLRIPRFFCRTHRRSLSRVPPRLLRHLHYEARVVNQAMARYVRGVPLVSIAGRGSGPRVHTISRWAKRVWEALELFKKRVVRLNRKPWGSWIRLTLFGLWEWLMRLASLKKEDRLPVHYALIRSP